jgi:hypothetical protein
MILSGGRVLEVPSVAVKKQVGFRDGPCWQRLRLGGEGQLEIRFNERDVTLSKIPLTAPLYKMLGFNGLYEFMLAVGETA